MYYIIQNNCFNCKTREDENQGSIVYYNTHCREKHALNYVSSIAGILDSSYDTFPQFLIHILKTDRYQHTELSLEPFLQCVGYGMADKFYSEWVHNIEVKKSRLNGASYLIMQGNTLLILWPFKLGSGTEDT